MRLIFSLLFVWIHLILFGQNTESFVQKPYLILRGTINFNNTIEKSEFNSREGTFLFENHLINSNIACSIGKPISNRMELGLQFSYSIRNSTNEIFDIQNFLNQSDTDLDLGVYHRYTINHNQKIKFYLRSSFTWQHSKFHSILARKFTDNSFKIDLIPEVSYAISPRINLVASIGNVFYHFQRTKKENQNTITDDFQINFNLANLKIGGELLFFHDKQVYSSSIISNKKFILGLDAHFNNYKDSNFNNHFYIQTSFYQQSFSKVKNGTTFSVHPYFGYNNSKRWTTGINFDYTYFNAEVSDFSKSYHTHNNKLGLGLFVRYTIHPNRKLKFLIDGNTTYNALVVKRNFENFNQSIDITKYTYLEFILTPKLSYNIHNQFNLIMSIGNLSYLTSINKQVIKTFTNIGFSEIRTNEAYNFNLNYGINHLRFGLEYSFGGK